MRTAAEGGEVVPPVGFRGDVVVPDWMTFFLLGFFFSCPRGIGWSREMNSILEHNKASLVVSTSIDCSVCVRCHFSIYSGCQATYAFRYSPVVHQPGSYRKNVNTLELCSNIQYKCLTCVTHQLYPKRRLTLCWEDRRQTYRIYTASTTYTVSLCLSWRGSPRTSSFAHKAMAGPGGALISVLIVENS